MSCGRSDLPAKHDAIQYIMFQLQFVRSRNSREEYAHINRQVAKGVFVDLFPVDMFRYRNLEFNLSIRLNDCIKSKIVTHHRDDLRISKCVT